MYCQFPHVVDKVRWAHLPVSVALIGKPHEWVYNYASFLDWLDAGKQHNHHRDNDPEHRDNGPELTASQTKTMFDVSPTNA